MCQTKNACSYSYEQYVTEVESSVHEKKKGDFFGSYFSVYICYMCHIKPHLKTKHTFKREHKECCVSINWNLCKENLAQID